MTEKTSYEIASLDIGDYDEILALWKRCEGIGLSSADDYEPIAAFLERNPGLSFAARKDGHVIGTSLCGSDGRRGYLYHLAVDRIHRRQGIGANLVRHSLDALRSTGIQKCHLMVMPANLDGQAFWSRMGWSLRGDILIMSKELVPREG